jgi:hypothetical protein
MHRAIASSILSVLACAAFASGAAAADGRKKGEHPLFQAPSPLVVTLRAPWPDVLKPGAAPKPYPAVLGYTDAQGQAHALEATVETRGITRRRLCHFPPLRLRFAKGTTAGSEFAGQDSLKMVTHCDNAASFKPYYVQELLAYRIYNLVTDKSFRARPLEVTYLDPQGGKPNGPRFAFLIEDVGDMAKRNGLEPDPRARFRPSDYDSLALSRFMLFQYLLGNTDWDVLSGPRPDECCHNVRVVGAPDAAGGRIPVPYDFDSSGMIGAKYAAPHASLPIKDVRTRLYRGLCTHNDTLEAARKEYQGLRGAIFALVQDEARLDPQRRKALANYLEGFYATLDDDARFASEITAKCRK